MPDPCQDCGACCLHLVEPPFFRIGEPEWTALLAERPDLVAEIEVDYDRRCAAGLNRDDHEAPCHWYDASTRRCRHYEHRPAVCREFEPGSEDCLRIRAERGILGPIPTAEADSP